MTMAYTATYRKIASGYMGQLVEWPEVITEGKDLDDCRKMLKDALREMLAAYRDDGLIPPGNVLYESIDIAN
ncbi:MAG: type II toxin-antitoxin system HicB family antitoxin [SAR324 cluster bacterium]|nr:type II toxin-antitoxin system HicB family antitoxin [SAR324 cluster bacterium]